MTEQHRETLNLYIRFVIRDILTTHELIKLRQYITETIQEMTE